MLGPHRQGPPNALGTVVMSIHLLDGLLRWHGDKHLKSRCGDRRYKKKITYRAEP